MKYFKGTFPSLEDSRNWSPVPVEKALDQAINIMLIVQPLLERLIKENPHEPRIASAAYQPEKEMKKFLEEQGYKY